MKKALIVIISAIYVFAIIIVSFLGIRSEVYNRNIDVSEIVLLNENVSYPSSYSGTKYATNDPIVVYKRPEESLIDPTTGKAAGMPVTWNYGSQEDLMKRDYAIYIYDTNFLYNSMGLGKTLELKTSVQPEDATKKELEYVLTGADAVVDTLTIGDVTPNGGAILFSEYYTSVVDVDVIIKATDSSNVKIDVLLRINKYRNS